MLDARKIIGTGLPTEEGRKLADHVLDNYRNLDVEIDVRGCRAALLISAFFQAFLDRIRERYPNALPTAKNIKWITEHSFQQENILRWMQIFPCCKPRLVHQSSYTGSLSGDSFTTEIFFFADLNLVVKREKYDSGRVFYQCTGGTPESQELAKEELER